jgi:4-amino-4-deoxy-L-arabinose transferase-like glycosyltransferase
MMRRALPWLLAAILLIAGFSVIDDYSVTWDEALGDLFFGQRYFAFFTTFDSRYLEFLRDVELPWAAPDLTMSRFRHVAWQYPPVSPALSAGSQWLLDGKLGLLDPFDAHHAVNLLLGAILLVVLYRFVERRFSPAAAALAVVLLFTSPRIAVHMMVNIKDFPQMVFFGVTLVAFYAAWERGSAGGIVASGLLWGLALGTKANALFLPFVIVLFLAATWGDARWRERRARLTGALAGAAALAWGVVLASWPYLWPAPLERLRIHYLYLATRHSKTDPENLAPAFEMILFTTPPLVLVLFFVGLAALIRPLRQRHPASLLLVAWSAVVAARLLIPGSINFDGVRHFLELFPPVAAIAGIGGAAVASALAQGVGRRLSVAGERAVIAAVLTVVIVVSGWTVVRPHPWQLVYWNSLIGGAGGAAARGVPQAGDYWVTGYRTGFRWANETLPPGALLIVPIAQHVAEVVAPVWLRDDIRLVNYEPGLPTADLGRLRRHLELARRVPVYVLYAPREEWANELTWYVETKLEPLRTWSVDGADVLVAYRLGEEE